MTNSIEKKCLLIGNNNYKKGVRLEYCVNNIQSIKEKLEKINFKVNVGIDLTLDKTELIIENFVNEITTSDLILFVYSGYGINLNNRNYLLPIDDQQFNCSNMFIYETLDLQNLINMIMNKRPLAALFLFDASRNYLIQNKNEKKLLQCGGLTSLEALPNCLILYSSDQNETIADKSPNGMNTFFIYHFVQHIDQLNLPLEELIEILFDEILNETDHQLNPFKVGTINKNIYFNYQIQSEISERRKSMIKEMILKCENNYLVDLRSKELIDRDMKVIVEQVLLNKQSKRLWLDSNHLTHIGASILASALNTNTCLERLYLNSNSISDIGIKYLSKSLLNNQTLKILSLQQNNISDLGIEHLANMIKINKTLTSLWLSNNSITDKGIKYLSNALINHNSTIQFIDLSKNRLINDLSYEYFNEMILFNKSLNELSLYDCNLSRTTKDKLKKTAKSKKNFTIYLKNWNE